MNQKDQIGKFRTQLHQFLTFLTIIVPCGNMRHLHRRFLDKPCGQIIQCPNFPRKMQAYLHHGSCLLGPTNADEAHRDLADLGADAVRRIAVPNAVLGGRPCCPSAVSRIRAWISPAWTSRTGIMRWGFQHCTVTAWQRTRLSHWVQSVMNLILTRQKRKGTIRELWKWIERNFMNSPTVEYCS